MVDIDRLLTNAALDTAVEVLLHKQSKCGGTIPQNFYTSILDGLHKKGIVISRPALHKRVSRASAKLQQKSPTVNLSPPTAEVVTFARQNGSPSSASTASSVTVHTSASASASASAAQSNADDDEGSQTVATPNGDSSSLSNDNTARKRSGRPKGTGIVQQQEKKGNYAKCKNAIVAAYVHRKACNQQNVEYKSNNDILREVIEEKKAEFNVTENIPLTTIKSRVDRNKANPSTHKLECKHPGIASPLELAEQYVLEVVLQMQKIRQPMTKIEVIELMSDSIKGTVHEDMFRQVKASRAVDALDLEQVGDGWWRRFLKRHKSKLSTSRGERFSATRAD